MAPHSSEVDIRTRQGVMPAYVAEPATAPPWPGVVVIHDFTGMSHDLRAQADWLAAAGYLAVAPDLYYWGNRFGCLRTIMRDLGERRGHRLLHGRRLRYRPRGRPRVRRLERQLRRLPGRRGGVAARRLPDRGQ